ncbi:rhamnogalacturonan acetylesterase [Echinicola vietnamensis]|uniref:Lysophospholipase L1-like esterase n=1 Tax=Echinicola vietnamensis (strain DSM 17526 / LMG 23754 / KMM 6221) TaxID=926556 RepID=L0G1X5_ECHVK|nr:rhamnogalacturonan acetylesterase [Echinicola vietnamensis]AGA79318.1 lysophospholipase L1-like esterase [Echinicola vietnamensis DSM 17526]
MNNLTRSIIPIIVLAGLLVSFVRKDQDITIFMIGDSTMANKPYSGSNPEKGWGQVFGLYFNDGVRVENHALNGRSTKSFRDEGHWDKVYQSIKPGDYVIIEFGHNDQKSKSPERYAAPDTDYRNNLIRYIEETYERGGKPVLATPISRRSYEDGVLVDTHGRYSEVVREVAAEYNIPLFDLHSKTVEVIEQFGEEKSKELFLHYKPGDYERFKEGQEDNTHLSPTGAFKVCDLAVAELKQELPELVIFLKD